jgi:RNA polymerase sigma factor (sigma-70 family)
VTRRSNPDPLERILRGDESAAADLYSRWRQAVFDLLVRRLGNVEEAEALAQDALLRSLDAARRGELRSFPAYAMRVARFVATDALRRRKVERAQAQSEHALPAETAPDRLDLPRLREAVDTLPEDGRRILDLRYAEGLSFAEIALALGMSKNGVFARHERALDLLRAHFATRRSR